MTAEAASLWSTALAAWAIPEDILARAPASPWSLPPALFAPGARTRPVDDASKAAALEALPAGGSVLDVGCGGGSASVGLAPPAARLVGVDESEAMLASFAQAAAGSGAAHRTVAGTWPEPAVVTGAGRADVVVCHHVAYNVAAIDAFLGALSGAAQRRVVVELTERHPLADQAWLWRRFWGIDRPEGPNAELFVEVVTDAGHVPQVTRRRIPPADIGRHLGHDGYVELTRRRLCLDPSRDAEVAAALAGRPAEPDRVLVTVTWDP